MARTITKKSWLYAYLDYVEELESPNQYKFWTGISAIASTLKNHVWLKRGTYNIYPNHYVILVGQPGIGKGTSINPATGLVKRAGTANYLSDRITAEKILTTLETGFTNQVQQQPVNGQQGQIIQTIGDKTATIISTELPVFLGASEWMIPLMCEMWEKGEFDYQTKNKGSVSAKGLCVSLVGACVPDYIRNLSKDSTAFITSGFSSRCIFVFANERGKLVSWPEVDSSHDILENALIDDLKYIANIKGEFKLGLGARELWDEFYYKLKPDEFESDVVTSFKARMVSHVLKLSMCLSVAEKNELIISKDNLFNAIKKIEEVKQNLDIAFRSIGESPLAVAQDRILRYVEMKGVVSRSQMLRDNMRHIGDEDLTRVLYLLEYTGHIKTKTETNKLMIYSTDKRAKQAQMNIKKGATPSVN